MARPSKLTEIEKSTVYQLSKNKETPKEKIALEFNISVRTIDRICKLYKEREIANDNTAS